MSMNIELSTQNATYILFPDGQPHVRLTNPPIVKGWRATVRHRIRSPHELFTLLQLGNAIRRSFGKIERLDIPYLMGARYDRLMLPGDSVDLQVVADAINSLGADHVRLLDVHSDVALQLIHNSENVTNEFLVRGRVRDGSVLVVPDAGAAKKAEQYSQWANLSGVVICSKARDLSTGKLKLQVPDVGSLEGRDLVVIDDICDGGATFKAIAEQTPGAKSRTLIVTHGIFSQGTVMFDTLYDRVVTSDSFRNDYNPKHVHCIPSII